MIDLMLGGEYTDSKSWLSLKKNNQLRAVITPKLKTKKFILNKKILFASKYGRTRTPPAA